MEQLNEKVHRLSLFEKDNAAFTLKKKGGHSSTSVEEVATVMIGNRNLFVFFADKIAKALSDRTTNFEIYAQTSFFNSFCRGITKAT